MKFGIDNRGSFFYVKGTRKYNGSSAFVCNLIFFNVTGKKRYFSDILISKMDTVVEEEHY